MKYKANPWNESLSTWKALLKPTQAGGTYTITARCAGCTAGGAEAGAKAAVLQRATFGDVWHCSGQSNMWFPVKSTYNRNDTVAAIKAGKYNNIHLMAGNSGTSPTGWPAGKGGGGFNAPYGAKGGSNQWMTAAQAIADGASSGLQGGNMSLFQFGATCWYFAQRLSELGVDVPIGLANTAIGGQRIEEYMDNTTIGTCSNRTGGGDYDGNLFAQQIVPFVDMTVKGWVWYQGENNMMGLKGNGRADMGYSCSQRVLIEGWRKAWSTTPGTTDPHAPFGIVTLASSGSEGGPNMGSMRQAQTAGFGVLPAAADTTMASTFFAQAYDLDDEWGGPSWGRMACHFNHEGDPCISGPMHQPCFLEWNCCPVGAGERIYNASTSKQTCNATRAKLCTAACAAAASTPEYMGGIHPRSKKPVGDRLGTAAYNTVYNGTGAYTGPTLAGCSLDAQARSLVIEFDTARSRSGSAPLKLNRIKPVSPQPPHLPKLWGCGARASHGAGVGAMCCVPVVCVRACLVALAWCGRGGYGVCVRPPQRIESNQTEVKQAEVQGNACTVALTAVCHVWLFCRLRLGRSTRTSRSTSRGCPPCSQRAAGPHPPTASSRRTRPSAAPRCMCRPTPACSAWSPSPPTGTKPRAAPSRCRALPTATRMALRGRFLEFGVPRCVHAPRARTGRACGGKVRRSAVHPCCCAWHGCGRLGGVTLGATGTPGRHVVLPHLGRRQRPLVRANAVTRFPPGCGALLLGTASASFAWYRSHAPCSNPGPRWVRRGKPNIRNRRSPWSWARACVCARDLARYVVSTQSGATVHNYRGDYTGNPKPLPNNGALRQLS